MIDLSQYEEGDEVRVIPDLKQTDSEAGIIYRVYVGEHMVQLAGQICKIIRFRYDKTMCVLEGGFGCVWSQDILEPVDSESDVSLMEILNG